MPLDKQLIDIALQGLDTKTDAKLVAPGKMLALENARFEKAGRISKALGSTLAVTTPGTVSRLFGFGGGVQAIRTTSGVTPEDFGRYSSVLGDFAGSTTNGNFRNQVACPFASADKVIQSTIGSAVTTQAASVDSCIVGSTRVYLTGVGTNIFATVVDTASKSVINNFLVTLGTEAHILPLTSTTFAAVIRVAGAGNIVVYECNISGTATSRGTFAIAQNIAVQPWDCSITASGSHIFIVARNPAVLTTVEIRSITVSSWASASTTFAAASNVQGLGVGSNTDARIVWADGSGNLFERSYSTALSAGISTTMAAPADIMTAISVLPDNTGAASIVASSSTITYTISATAAGTGSIAAKVRNVYLASKLTTVTINSVARYFAMVTFSSGIQSRFYLVEFFANGGTFAYTRAALASDTAIPYQQLNGTPTKGCLPTMSLEPSYTTRFVCPQQVSTPGGSAISEVVNCAFDYDPLTGWDAVDTPAGGLITGGFLQVFDGVCLRENGYLMYPTILSATPAAAGGSLVDGVRSVILIYERVDGNGNLHQSQVSVPASATVSGGGGAGKITISATPYTITNNLDSRVVAYRTVAGGTTYYRDTEVYSDPFATTVTLSLTQSDTAIQSNQIIYTTGGAYEKFQPDAPCAIAADDFYVYSVSGNDRYAAIVSQPISSGYGVSFYKGLSKQLASEEGPITGLARQDGRLFACKKRQIYMAQGAGPDVTGANDTLSSFQKLQMEIGAKRQRSILASNAGIFVHGNKGIWMIGRDLQASYIGAEVEDFTNASDIYDACLVPDKDEVRFLMAGSGATQGALCFNSFFKTWSRLPYLSATAITHSNGSVYFNADTSVSGVIAGLYKESGFANAHTSPTSNSTVLNTSWIKLSSIQGFMRVYELLILGEFKSTHTLQVYVYFDYVSSGGESHTITGTNATDSSSAYQFRVKLNRQKCESIMVIIGESSGATSENYNISGLAVLAGLKRGAYKLNAAKTV